MTNRPSGVVAALVFGLAALLLPVVAAAEDGAAEAFEEGVSLFKAGKFEKAAAAFERAYELKPTYKLQFNIGQAHAAARNYGLAVKAFERYLVEGGDNLTNERREEVVSELARLRPLVGFLKIRGGEEGLVVKIDGRERGVTPVKGKIGLTVGRLHIVQLVRGDEVVFVEEVELSGGAIETLEVTGAGEASEGDVDEGPEPAAAGEDEDGGADPETLKLAGWITLGGGAALLVAGAVVGGLAVSQGNTLDDMCPGGDCSPARQGEIDTLGTMALTTDILLGVGGAAAATGAVLLIVGHSRGEAGPDGDGTGDDAEVSLLPMPGGMAVDVRF